MIDREREVNIWATPSSVCNLHDQTNTRRLTLQDSIIHFGNIYKSFKLFFFHLSISVCYSSLSSFLPLSPSHSRYVSTIYRVSIFVSNPPIRN